MEVSLMKGISVWLSIMATVLVVCHLLLPAPAPLTEQEKEKISQEIADKIEWSIYGDTVTGVLPIIEIPESDPFFRIVRVFRSDTKDGYHFKEEPPNIEWRVDIGKFIQERRAK
jgi:hypothetical protein